MILLVFVVLGLRCPAIRHHQFLMGNQPSIQRIMVFVEEM